LTGFIFFAHLGKICTQNNSILYKRLQTLVLHIGTVVKMLHICESKCFIWQGGFYEARLTAYEAALRAMKRTFGA
jgi:hypothetical protein